MIGKYPVFVPKILPRDEYFVSGRRSCKGCGKALAVRMISKMLAKDMIFSDDTGAALPLSSSAQARAGLAWDELLSGDVTASLIDRFAAYREGDDKGKGRNKRIKKPVIGIDRRIFSKDPLALTGILKEHKQAVFICYDSEMYMDELLKKTLPSLDAHGDTHPVEKGEMRGFIRNKNIPSQVRESDLPYIATCCPSFPLDLMEKIKKGLRISGTAFISVLAPCPTGWLFNPDQTAHLGFLAVNTGFYPLFEIEEGRFNITQRISKPHPLGEYLKAQQRHIPFPPEITSLMQEVVREEHEKLLSGA